MWWSWASPALSMPGPVRPSLGLDTGKGAVTTTLAASTSNVCGNSELLDQRARGAAESRSETSKPSGVSSLCDSVFALLRCAMCKDVLRTAVALRRCSHVFCSLCIRRHLLDAQYCPMCRCEAWDSEVVSMRRLDAVIHELRKAQRQCGSSELGASAPAAGQNPPLIAPAKRRRASEVRASRIDAFFSGPRGGDSAGAASSTWPCLRCTYLNKPQARACALCRAPRPRVSTNGDATSVSRISDPASTAKDSATEIAPADHSTTQPSRAAVLDDATAPTKRLPIPCYHGLKITSLRRMLRDAGLPTGSREVMVSRHKEFIIRYNVHADAMSGPVDTARVAREVLRQEQRASRSDAFKTPFSKAGRKRASTHSTKSALLRRSKRHKGARERPFDPFLRLIREYRSRNNISWTRRDRARLREKFRIKRRQLESEERKDSTAKPPPPPPFSAGAKDSLGGKRSAVVPTVASKRLDPVSPSPATPQARPAFSSPSSATSSPLPGLGNCCCLECIRSYKVPRRPQHCVSCGLSLRAHADDPSSSQAPPMATAPPRAPSGLTSEQRVRALKNREKARKRLKAKQAKKTWANIFSAGGGSSAPGFRG